MVLKILCWRSIQKQCCGIHISLLNAEQTCLFMVSTTSKPRGHLDGLRSKVVAVDEITV